MSWRICQCYLIPATRASGRAAAVVAVTLVDRFMTSQAMNQLCWHHAQMGDRVRREVGAEGMGTEPNWGETQAMAEQTTSKERSHNPRSGFGGIRTKTVLPRFQERSQVSQLLPKWTSIRSKPGSIVGQEDINSAIVTEFRFRPWEIGVTTIITNCFRKSGFWGESVSEHYDFVIFF